MVGKGQVPEVSLKLVSCVKKNDREIRESIGNLFGDVGKCFDDAKGSVLTTLDCMLTNGVLHTQGAIAVVHRVLGCTLQKQKSEFRLCLSATTASDDTCPFAVGV
ncbi:50S ribosomal protein L17 [Frankliniella fusca]|uniref:50S ribosomal protein L17 n=1 Tax=Frankliniella fusca TaxID=407009 RepID=A0AAE1GWW0_9NEOP|nr:50S ribosomal protein L17 [Frankliniella fusca]